MATADPTPADNPLAPPPGRWSDASVRAAAGALAVVLAVVAVAAQGTIPTKLQAGMGIVCFVSLVWAFSSRPRAVDLRIVAWGFALQVALALLILKFEVNGERPFYEFFRVVGDKIKLFLSFTDAGSRFVFGDLADPAKAPGGFIFAVQALPPIVFASAVFSLLYHWGLLQFIVRVMAFGMIFMMRTSGAETLSATANVFLGQTEAPLLIRAFVPRMTQSELCAVMVGGFATISGALMGVYIGFGADAVSVLTTSLMAAPAGLYLSKILIPETGRPETAGDARAAASESTYANSMDAFASGASGGMSLAINVAAMLIAFLAAIALVDSLLGGIKPTLAGWGVDAPLPDGLSLSKIFSWGFAPVAALMGTPPADIPVMADLLGTKLVANEFVAFLKLKEAVGGLDPHSAIGVKDAVKDAMTAAGGLDPRTAMIAAFALTGFANFASVGIQLGGIGAMAPERRADLAKLGMRTLMVGFVVTLVNACVAVIVS